MELIIIMDGGIIQEVLSPEPEKLKDLKITVVDYDVEDCEPDVLEQVQQSNGEWEDAFTFTPVIERLQLIPFNIRPKEQT